MIEQVPAFKTSDGRIFSDKIAAIKHEYALEIRGFFQTRSINKTGNYSSTEIAHTLATCSSEFQKIAKKYQLLINRNAPKPVTAE